MSHYSMSALTPTCSLNSIHTPSDLLTKLSWDPSHDTLFFAGDLIAKSDHSDSLAVWDFIYKNHINDQGRQVIYPVRGNHDQIVVQWRGPRKAEIELHASENELGDLSHILAKKIGDDLSIFDDRNGRTLTLSNDDAYDLVIAVAEGRLREISELAGRIERGSRPVSSADRE